MAVWRIGQGWFFLETIPAEYITARVLLPYRHMTTEKTSAPDLRKLSKTLLIEETHRIASQERQITLDLLWHLKEIDRRKIPQEMGMSGIFDYCVRVLNYSEGSAFRRVQSMRAMNETPELEKRILDGKMNLTTASQLQTFLQRAKREGVPIPQAENKKAEFFQTFEGLSSRKVEEKLSEISPILARREHERPLNDHELEVRLTISADTKKRWVRISELAAHRMNFDPSTRRIVELSAEMAVTALEKEKMGARPLENASEARPHSSGVSDGISPDEKPADQNPGISSRHIPAPLRRLVWWRDQGRCTYRTQEGKIRCTSRFALEIDHIKPFSLGGSSHDADNLRLLCKSHHQLLTQRTFGEVKKEDPRQP